MVLGFVRRREWVAACIRADSSGFRATSFYLEAFVMPLFVPSPHLYFNYGFRIGGLWDGGISDEVVAAVQQALPRLSRMGDLGALERLASRPSIDIHHAELRLGVGILLRDPKRIAAARAILTGFTTERAWEVPVLERCRATLDTLDRGGIDAATAGLALIRNDVLELLA